MSQDQHSPSRNPEVSEPLDPAEVLKMADEITRVVDGGHHKAYGTDPHRSTMTAGNAWWRTVADAMRAYARSESATIESAQALQNEMDAARFRWLAEELGNSQQQVGYLPACLWRVASPWDVREAIDAEMRSRRERPE